MLRTITAAIMLGLLSMSPVSAGGIGGFKIPKRLSWDDVKREAGNAGKAAGSAAQGLGRVFSQSSTSGNSRSPSGGRSEPVKEDWEPWQDGNDEGEIVVPPGEVAGSFLRRPTGYPNAARRGLVGRMPIPSQPHPGNLPPWAVPNNMQRPVWPPQPPRVAPPVWPHQMFRPMPVPLPQPRYPNVAPPWSRPNHMYLPQHVRRPHF